MNQRPLISSICKGHNLFLLKSFFSENVWISTIYLTLKLTKEFILKIITIKSNTCSNLNIYLNIFNCICYKRNNIQIELTTEFQKDNAVISEHV